MTRLRKGFARFLLLGAAWLPCALPAAEAPTAPAPAPAPAPAHSAADFAQIPFVENASISPDGLHIAGIFGLDGARRIAILNLFDRSEKPVVVAMPDGTEADDVQWVNRDNIIVRLRMLIPLNLPYVTGPDRVYVTRVVAVNRISHKLTRLLWNMHGLDAADVVHLPTDGSAEIEIAAQDSIFKEAEFWPTVYRVNVETGQLHMVQAGREDVLEWTADTTGRVRLGMGYEDSTRSFRLLYRGEHADVFHKVDQADTRKRERVIQPLVFLPGGDHALVRHEDEHGHDQIYEMDLISRQDVHPFYTAPEGQWVQHVILSADESTVLGVRLGGGDRAIHWLDPTLAEVQAQFDKAVGNRRAEILSLTPDRKRMLVLLDRADTPGALYFYDIDQGRLQKLAPLNQPLGTTPLAPVRHVSFHARDGLAIEAILTLPPGLPAYKLPIIMLPHGGPWAHDSLDYDYWAQFLAAQGYAVMQPNFRGSTGYGTAFERKGEGQLGLAMQDDITDGLKWAVAQGLADPARACIMGGSYGGYAAMWGAAKDPDLYRCAISIAGVASLRREVNGFGDYLMGNKYRDDWGRMSADFAAVSPANAADRIKAPLLLIHGSKDVTVNPAQSELMASRMRAAGKTFEYLPLPLADHHFGRQPDRQKLLETVAAFLARYNPANSPTIPAAGPANPPPQASAAPAKGAVAQ